MYLSILAVAVLASHVCGLSVYTISEPCGPGDVCTVTGDQLPTSTITACWTPGACRAVTLLQPTALAAKFVLPSPPASDTAAALSVYSITVSNGTYNVSVTLGAPSVEWWIAPAATLAGQAVVGTPLYLFGRNLAVDAFGSGKCLAFTKQDTLVYANTTVIATPSGTGPYAPGAVTLGVPAADAVGQPVRSCFRVDAQLPPDMPVGTYDIYVLNGLLGVSTTTPAAAGVNVVAPAVWPAATLTLGSSPGCSTVPECMTSVTTAGGGTIVVPAGTFYMPSSSQILFPCTVPVAIVGAGRDVSSIVWSVGTGLIAGTNPVTWNSTQPSGGACAAWAVTDVTIASYAAPQPGYQPPLGMDTVHVPAGAGPGGFARCRIVNDLTASPGIQLGSAFAAMNSSGFALEDVELVQRGNCAAQWPNCAALAITLGCDRFFLRGVTVTTTCPGYSIASSTRFAMMDGVWTSVGPVSEGQGVNSLTQPNVMEHAYMGNVTFLGAPDAPERWESMTFDGPGGAYNGTVTGSVVNGDGSETLSLSSALTCSPWGRFACLPTGMTVAIMRGTGTGQTRRLVAATPTSVTVDAPFAPSADASSFVTVVGYKGRITFEGNTFVNGTSFQVYGGALDVMVAGNAFSEMFDSATFNVTSVIAGVRLVGHRYQGGFETAWRNMLLHNDVHCASAVVAYSDVIDNVTFSFAHTFRDNAITGGVNVSLSYVWDPVLQNNTFAPAFCAYAGATLPAGRINVNSTSPGAVVV